MTQPDDSDNMSNDTKKNIVLLETQVTDLKAQLQTANAEKDKLLDLLKNEQARTLALSPPKAMSPIPSFQT